MGHMYDLTTNYSIATRFSRAILNRLPELGVIIPAALTEQLVHYQHHQRLPLDIQNQLWLYLEQHTQAEFGLKLGFELPIESYDLLGYIMLNSASLAAAVEHLVRYSALLGEGGIFQQSHQPEGWRITYKAKFSEARALRLEAILACVANGARWVANSSITPVQVAFEHNQRAPIEAYRQVFGDAELIFAAPHNYLVYPDHEWRKLRRHGNAQLHAELNQHAQELLKQLKPQHFSTEVQRVLVQHPSYQRHDVAAYLAISERHLNRRLAAEQVSFKVLADKVRQTIALHALTNESRTDTELAQRLGYADGEAFAKAFKRWFGVRPRAYLKQFKP